MAEAILLCGRICSGKTTHAQRLREEKKAVVLSCDELVLSILGDELGERHDEILERVKAYLYAKSLEVLESGTDVILEWGFWSAADRKRAKEFFASHGYQSRLYYIDLSEEQWRRNIDCRNRAVSEGTAQGYMVDDGLLAKLERHFQPPAADEVDVVLRRE